MKDPTCKNCIALTSGDCGQHNTPQELKEEKYCTRCGKPESERFEFIGCTGPCNFQYKVVTQEPMEWAKEFEEMEKNHGWLPEHKERVKQFIQSQIKQVEERHNQDCTREDWARHSERNRIVKEIEKLNNKEQKYPGMEEYIRQDVIIKIINPPHSLI